MENEKVKFLIDMINNMDIKDKLRLAICMSQSNWSGLIYNTKENYEKFDFLRKDKVDLDKADEKELLKILIEAQNESNRQKFCLTY